MENASVELQNLERAFNRRIRTFAIVNKGHSEIEAILNDAFNIYRVELTHILEEYSLVKTLSVFAAEFEKKNVNVNDQSNDIFNNSDDATASNEVREIDSHNEQTNSEQEIKETLYSSKG